jgi:hypothetical protein
MKTRVSNTLSTFEQIIQPKSEKIILRNGADKNIITFEKLNPNGQSNITLSQVAEKLKNNTWDVEGISKAEGELLAQQIDILNNTNNSIVDLALIMSGVYENTFVSAVKTSVDGSGNQTKEIIVNKTNE